MVLKRLTPGLFLIAVLGIWGCEHAVAPEPLDFGGITKIDYNKHVQRLFNENCTDCHGNLQAESGLNLSSWEQAIAGSDFGEAFIPFDSKNSRMIEILTKLNGGPHPKEYDADTLSTEAGDFLAGWIDEGAQNGAGESPFQNSTNRLYVCNQNQNMVSIVDTEANVVIRNIKMDDLGYSIDSAPHFTAVEPDGSFWYLTLIRDGKVLKLNMQNEVVAEADVPVPAMLFLHPTEDVIYVSRFMSPDSPPTSVFIFNRETMTPVNGVENGEISVNFRIPHAMAGDHAGKFLYTASIPQNQLIVIDHAAKEVDEFISLGANKGPLQARVSPDDKLLFLSLQAAGQMLVLDVSDPQDRKIVATIDVGANPWHPAFSPDGRFVYVGNNGSRSVSIIDVAALQVVATIEHPSLAQPHGMAVSRNGFAYVSNRNLDGSYKPRHDFGDNANDGTISIIDLATNQIVKVLEVGRFASGVSLQE